MSLTFVECSLFKAEEKWSNQESELLAEVWANVVCLLDPARNLKHSDSGNALSRDDCCIFLVHELCIT